MIPADRVLKLSLDRKVSPRGLQQPGGIRPGRWLAKTRNSFGLSSRITCPGLTEFCADCYVVNTERSAGVADALHHNTELLAFCADGDEMEELLVEMVGRYRAAADHCRPPLTDAERVFRIHWSGDFFSVEYAEAWARTMRRFDDVQFWAYTRSFVEPVNVVPVLAPVGNLSLYLSVDRWNATKAAEVVRAHPEVLVAAVDVDYRRAREIATAVAVSRDGDAPPVVCPENAGRLKLMNDGVGACVTCMVCVAGRRDVLFSTSHIEDVAVPVAIAGQCAAPGCANRLLPSKGRPRKFCSDPCRWREYRTRQKAPAHA